jgi:integrase
MTFGDLVDRYMAEYSRIHKRPRSIADDEYYLAHYVPPTWRTRRLSDISRADVGRLHAGLSKDHGRYAGNHTVRLLRAMLNWARDRGVLRGDNPARIKLFAEKRRERFLTPEELIKVNAALLEEPDWRWRAYFPLTLMLGTRKSELLAARWADVDLAQRTLRLPETKAGRPHLLPLPQAAAEMLAALPSRGKSEHVFPGVGAAGHVMEPAKAWQRVRARAGVVDVRIHDLRHTLASWLVAAGYGLPLIGRALNHAQVATTERYAHLALDSVRTALEKNAALMFGTTQPAAADNSGEGSESSQNVAVDKIG